MRLCHFHGTADTARSCVTLLNELRLVEVRVQSTQPLASSSITRLWLKNCENGNGDPPLFRQTLPTMKNLAWLKLEEPYLEMMMTSPAEPLNAALLARCPLLQPKSFFQTLLDNRGAK